ncbi:MAG TPA: hypothetical protein VG733_14425, partial [Chthoniobacteraceae bacterium]|nr:hypothetical protein [Chthoniobacteraceae bacterium]
MTGGIVTQPAKTILFVSGEISGDMNTAKLATLLLERNPGWTLHAVGGSHLADAVKKSPGGEWVADTSDLSGIGIYSSIRMVPRARKVRTRMREFVRAHRIDAAVLCDWGAFNCRQFPFFEEMG